MVLLNCTSCHDVVRVRGPWTRCSCGLSAARGGKALEVWGHGRMFRMDEREYRRSLDDRRVALECLPLAEDGLRVRRAEKGPDRSDCDGK